jgi:hypothetical protein
MKKRLFVAISMAILASSLVSIAPASAGSFCNNGSYSANSGRGTCSYNGGVNKSFPSYSDPGSSSFNRNYGLGSTSSWSRTPSYGSSRNYGLGSTSSWSRTPSYGSSRNYGLGSTSSWSRTPSYGSSRNYGLGSTSNWGNSLNSNR